MATRSPIAKRAEANGFEALFRSDHYASFPGAAGQPTTDAWTVIAGLARETERLSLGALVSPVTFRHPGTFAKIVTTVDEMSGGRIEVGVGAGWNDLEHRQLGLAFPPIGERADLMEDQLAVLHGLWGEPDGWSYDGKTVDDRGRALLPEAGRRAGPPDGAERRRAGRGSSSAAAARRAAPGWPRAMRDEFNCSRGHRRRPREVRRVDEAACAAIGRDPATLARSVMTGALVGRTRTRSAIGTAAARRVRRRRRRRRVDRGAPRPLDPRARATGPRDGPPFADAGVERLMLQDFIPGTSTTST